VISITNVPQKDNAQTNFLSKLASVNPADPPIDVWIEVLDQPSVG
jgi:hypothetical protein